ncbi:hypothetical protein KEJ19_05270, partial [Candidatus Bathyarchaeota archaeon]|nr:hypothetical protein [Candidatus Bathyarchaeota archaeon]
AESELLLRLVYEADPAEAIVGYLVGRLLGTIDLDDIGSSYGRIEDELCEFEEWLHDIWGIGFYASLLGKP